MAEAKPTTGRTLVSKLAEVMKEVSKIPKNGKNTFHNYKYVMESDLVEAIRDKLADRHIFITSCTKGIEVVELGKVNNKTGEFLASKTGVLRVDYTFHDGESGETLTMESIGEIDQDGGKGLYKALTGSMKYFLMKNFLVATGDDPEQDSGKQPPKAPVAPQRPAPPVAKPQPAKQAERPQTAPVQKPAETVKPLFPHEAGDTSVSKEQIADAVKLWSELMDLQGTNAGKVIPDEKRATLLMHSLTKKYGVKTIASLRSKQATHMIDGLKKAVGKAIDTENYNQAEDAAIKAA